MAKLANDNIGWGKDLSGLKFGRLTVLSFAGRSKREKNQTRLWHCRCDCGNERIVEGGGLRSGQSASCGCLKRERTSARHKTHGMADKHPIYWIWQGMKTRCHNPNAECYHNYGGRGISVEEPWRSSFVEFAKDMLPSWRKGMTIERKQVNGNYCKNNCEWIPWYEQVNNRRVSFFIERDGETKTLAKWCVETGMSYITVYSRIQRGWPKELWFTRSCDLPTNGGLPIRFSTHERRPLMRPPHQ